MIRVENLRVEDATGYAVLDDLSLTVGPGERVGIVGESGAGKTTLALALVGAVRPGLRVLRGQVAIDGCDVLTAPAARVRHIRRRTVSYLPQDPASALTPTVRVGNQIRELATDRSVAAVTRGLTEVGLPGDVAFQRRYPHQLSGGQQQRLALARLMAGDPMALVLDEPTTGLDGPMRRLVLDQLDELATRRGLSMVFITHDLNAAARMVDRLMVLRGGSVVEHGVTDDVLNRPTAVYTKALVAAVPDVRSELRRRASVSPVSPAAVDPARVALEVSRLTAVRGRGRTRRVVLDDVSLRLHEGESLALLGTSGCGKTTLARCVTGMLRPESGSIELFGDTLPPLLGKRPVEQRRRVQLIPQDSSGSLNPRRTVGAAIGRVARRAQSLSREAAKAETLRLMGLVGLPDELAGRLPRELSGGQRQRVAIARALAARADVLVCDEITSNLDVQVEAAVLGLLDELRRTLRLALLLITHDLGVIARNAERVVVLSDGVVVEEGAVADIMLRPGHAGTRVLVDSVLTDSGPADPADAAPSDLSGVHDQADHDGMTRRIGV